MRSQSGIPEICHGREGQEDLYVLVLKAIYGMIESALLWYELFTTTVTGLCFELNLYDRCLANKMINGKQRTIAWYVDDNKISHMDDKVNTMIADEVEKKFGKLARTTGRRHTFLGIDIELIGDGKMAISTLQHFEECMKDFGDTKPLQGSLFRTLRVVVMGWEDVDTLLKLNSSSTDKERVGNDIAETDDEIPRRMPEEEIPRMTYAQALGGANATDSSCKESAADMRLFQEGNEASQQDSLIQLFKS